MIIYLITNHFQNPNLRPQRQKKVSELSNASSSKAQLTRREREEVEKQKAKAHYQVFSNDFISEFGNNTLKTNQTLSRFT